MALDSREHLLGIEALHDDHGPTEPVDAHGPEDRRRVIQRRGRQIRVPLADSEGRQEVQDGTAAFAHRRARQRPPDPLRATGRTGRVLEHIAFGLARDRLGRASRASIESIGSYPSTVSTDRPPPLHRGRRRLLQSCRHVMHGRADDDQPRAGIRDDVSNFVRLQMRVHRQEIHAAAQYGPRNLVVSRPVLHHQRHDVAMAQAGASECMCQSVGAFVRARGTSRPRRIPP